jgi:predicted nucleic acid-binding protein
MLATHLHELAVVVHPFIIGELALGAMRDRAVVLGSLAALPQVPRAEEEEVLLFVTNQRLWGRGIGYIDAHLLAAVRLSPGTLLWTRDKRLKTVAEEQGVAAALA